MSSSHSSAAESSVHHCQLPCGLVLLGQPMPWLRSASFAWVLPAGSQLEPTDRYGLSGIVCEMVQRGAGPHSSRDVVNLSDNLGLERNASVSSAHTVLSGSLPAEALADALALYTEIIRRPHLPGNQLDDARNVALQELRAIDDDPVQRVMTRLKELHYGTQIGHSTQGDQAGIVATTAFCVQGFYERHYRPQGAMLAVAGQFDWDRLVEEVSGLLDGWPEGDTPLEGTPQGRAAYEYIHHDSAQTHIGLAFPALPGGHPDYFTMRAAVGVLSDGMSSRLFDRVREQRGLCYTVSASAHSVRGAGGIFAYAGTTPERAQETLDVTLREIKQLGSTVEKEELDRFKVRIQSNLVMQQESSAARASSLASDWYYLGRVLEPAEIEARVEAVTPTEIEAVWQQLEIDSLRVVTLGPEPLAVPGLEPVPVSQP